jgi:hypothetical protein
MEATDLWGVTEDDSVELHEHITYLSQHELRTSTANRESWRILIAQVCVSVW